MSLRTCVFVRKFVRTKILVLFVAVSLVMEWGESRAFAYSQVNPTAHTVTSPRVPNQLEEAGITEKLGVVIDFSSYSLRDELGRQRNLQELMVAGKPVILNFVYYNCPSLCGLVLNGLLKGLQELDWTAGEQFEIVTVSMDARETAALAREKKANYLDAYGRATQGGWHFLTGSEAQVRALAKAVGFGFRWDSESQQFAHSAALILLTPEGKISRYLYGIDFPEKNLKLALLEASGGRVSSITDRVLLFCFKYDPSSRGYALQAYRLVQAGSAGSVVIFGGYLIFFWRRQKKRPG